MTLRNSINIATGEDRYSVSFYVFCVAVVLVYLNFFRAAYDPTGITFGSNTRFLSIVGAPIFLVLATLIALMEGQLKRLQLGYQLWFVFLLFTVIILGINGILHGNAIRLVTLDILLFTFVFPGLLIGAKEINWVGFDRLVIVLFFLTIVNLLPYLSSYADPTAFDEAHYRHNVITRYGQTPYFFWGALGMWPYLVLTINDRGSFEKLVIVLGTVLYFYFSIIYLKRAPFVMLGLFLALIYFSRTKGIRINNSRRNSISILAVITLFVVTIFVYFGDVVYGSLDRLSERFMVDGSVLGALMSSDRLTYDVYLVLSQLSNIEYLMGRGFGGAVIDENYQYPETLTITLHNSSALMFLKGGVLLILVWFSGWAMMVYDFVVERDSSLRRYFIPVTMSVSLAWVFGFLSSTVYFAILTMCAGRIAAKKNSVTTVA